MGHRVAVATLALLLVACGGGGSVAPSPSPTPTPSPEMVQTTLWFVGDTPLGFRLYPEVHAVPAMDGVALSSLRALVDGALRPDDPDLSSPWAGAGSAVRSLARDDGGAVIDLALGRLNVGAEAEARAIDQLVMTVATADPTVETVAILVDGAPIESLAGHVDVTRPFAVADSAAAVATVTIAEPTEGATVTGDLVIGGEACTFEAAVPWQVLRDGEVVAEGTALAAGSCPARTAWTADVGALPPGVYTVRAYDLSARDGSLIGEDTKVVTIA